MRRIPPRFLQKEGGKWRPVRLRDIVTLLASIKAASENADIGFSDALQTEDQVYNQLNKTVLVDPNVIESALWCCNMLNELELFEDYRGRTFDQFVVDALNGHGTFDKTYSTVEWKK